MEIPKKMSASQKKKRDFQSPKEDITDFVKSKLNRLTQKYGPKSDTNSDNSSEHSEQETDDDEGHKTQTPKTTSAKIIHPGPSSNRKRKLQNNESDSFDDEVTDNALKDEVARLKKELKEKDRQIADLTRRNAGLQEKMLSRLDDLGKSVEDIEKKKTANEAGKETFEKVRAIKGAKTHVGRNVWIKKSKYDLVLVTAKSPRMFINSLAEATFGFETLINSSVTGKVSNRTKKLNPNARPSLNPQTVCTIQDCFENWARTCTPPLDSINTQFFRNEVPTVISHYITKLRSRHCRKVLDSTKKSNSEDDTSVSKVSDTTESQVVDSLEKTINNSNPEMIDLSETDLEETVDARNDKVADNIQNYSKEKSLKDEVFSEMNENGANIVDGRNKEDEEMVSESDEEVQP